MSIHTGLTDSVSSVATVSSDLVVYEGEFTKTGRRQMLEFKQKSSKWMKHLERNFSNPVIWVWDAAQKIICGTKICLPL